MTTPEPPDEAGPAPRPEATPQPADAASAVTGVTPPVSGSALPPGPAGPPPPGYPVPPPGYPAPPPGYPPNYPFAATVREPWINPNKRGAAGLLAAAGAVVLLGIGFGIGAAAFSGGDGPGGHRVHPGNMMRGGIDRGGMMGGYGRVPGLPRRPQPSVVTPTTVPATPVPSSSPS